jgi:hypothetical protein
MGWSLHAAPAGAAWTSYPKGAGRQVVRAPVPGVGHGAAGARGVEGATGALAAHGILT